MKKLATILLALLSCLGSALAQEPSLPDPTGTIADTTLAARHMDISDSCYVQGRYRKAWDHAVQAREIYEALLGVESFGYARATHQMGVVKLAEGKPDEAQKWLREALPVYEKTVGALSEEVANTQETLGLCLKEKFAGAAVSHIEKALRIRQQLYGLEHAEVARVQLNLGTCYHQTGNTEKAIFYYEQCLETRKKVEGEAYRGDHSVYHNLGVIYDNKHDRAKAREYYLKSLNLRLAGTNLDEVAQSYLALCYLEGEMGNCEQALRYGAEGLKMCQETRNKIREAQLLHAYADACRNKGDFDLAGENYELSLTLLRQELGGNHLSLATVLNSIATANASGPAHAREYLLEALAICEKNGNPPEIYAVTCINLAENYDKFGDLDNAVKYARLALDVLAKNAGAKQHDIGNVWQNLGNYYSKKGELAQTDHAYDQAEKAFRAVYPPFHQAITAVIRNRASARIRRKDYAGAVPLLQETLSRLNQTVRDPRTLHALFQDWADMETRQGNYVTALALADSAIAAAGSRLGRFEEGLSEEYVWANVLKGQVCLRYFGLTQQPVVLDEARIAFQRADTELQRCLNSAMRESDKSSLMHYAVAISEGLTWVETARPDADAYDKAFEMSEQAKARSLRAAFQETRARKLAGIPDSLLEQAHRLNVDIAFWETTEHKLAQAGAPEDDTTRLEARAQSAELRRRHDRLVRHFETKYTKYHRLRYDLRTETVLSVQRDLLRPGQTLLEYFTGDSVIFIYVIRPDTYRMVRISRDFPLEKLVQDMRSGITDCGPESDLPAAMDRYARAAHRLYQKLIAPVAADIPAGDQIILVPDGLLTYIPFEALLTEPPAELMDWHRYKYWVLKHDISYCYSATLLREMREREHRAEPKGLFLGMAPTYAGDTTAIKSSARDGAPDTRLQALDYNDVEVDSLQHLLGGQIYTGADATKARFVQEAGRYRILHPALHGNADDRSGDYSFLAFYEDPDHGVEQDRLYVREVYNLALNADLVTLSACQTNIGELRRGEGIIGLTRAFAYAGAKSIVGSLWNAHDKNTMLFMVDFYRRLKSGARKDAALAGAKRAFIIYGDERSHPFFWAAFVGVGDMREVR